MTTLTISLFTCKKSPVVIPIPLSTFNTAFWIARPAWSTLSWSFGEDVFVLDNAVSPTVKISNLEYPDPLSVMVTLLTDPVDDTTIVASAPVPDPPDNAIPV